MPSALVVALRARAPIAVAAVAVVGTLGIVPDGWLDTTRAPAVAPDVAGVSVGDPVDVQAVIDRNPRVLPGPDIYALLERCIRAPSQGTFLLNTVASQVRRWVEIDGAPAWVRDGAWWLPLQSPDSDGHGLGAYVLVPIDGSRCRGALLCN